MSANKVCPECSGTDLFARSDVVVRGGYGPDLLPGTSGVFSSAKVTAVVCKGCGLMRYYASRESLAKINAKNGWHRL